MAVDELDELVAREAEKIAGYLCKGKNLPPDLDAQDVRQAMAEHVLQRREDFQDKPRGYLHTAMRRAGWTVIRKAWGHPHGLTETPSQPRVQRGKETCPACNGWADAHDCERVETTTMEAAELPPPPAGQEEADYAALAVGWERGGAVRDALDRLPPRQRKFILGAFVARMTLAEVAAQEGVSLSTLKRDLALARESLREMLEHVRP